MYNDLADGDNYSEHIHLLFDCCSFPRLEKIEIGSDQGYLDDMDDDDDEDQDMMMTKWIQSPSTSSVELLTRTFPHLKEISHKKMKISRNVADLLGKIKRL